MSYSHESARAGSRGWVGLGKRTAHCGTHINQRIASLPRDISGPRCPKYLPDQHE
jgi:hypothetical protein